MAVDLMELLPYYFRPVLEFQEIMKVHGLALDDVEKQITQVGRNCFIQTADAETLRAYETLFGLVYKPGETLEYRRQRILQMYNRIAPFSIGFFRERLTELFGNDYVLEVDPFKSTLFVLVTSEKYGAVDLLYSLVWDIVPAHLEVTANHQVTNEIKKVIYAVPVMTNVCIQNI